MSVPQGYTRQAAYNDYLNSWPWKLRCAIKKWRAGYKCQVCSSSRSLSVHHRTYDRFGHERLSDLTVLCIGFEDSCHNLFHRYGKLRR